MKDSDCVDFLQWALPVLRMRWQGFRRVRAQVCKRIRRRMAALQLESFAGYREHLQARAGEWKVLYGLCRVTISRFYRDKAAFESLERHVLPRLAALALERHERTLRVWSAGCASGEEPYTLRLLWEECLRSRFPGLELRILGTDTDPRLLNRAATACYSPASVKDLPPDLKSAGFVARGARRCLAERYRSGVEFRAHDIRDGAPGGRYHLILCRNLVFTYFSEDLQRAVVGDLWRALHPGGGLVIGAHEVLPGDACGFKPWQDAPKAYRRVPRPQ